MTSVRIIGYWRPSVTIPQGILGTMAALFSAPDPDSHLPDPHTLVNRHWDPRLREKVLWYLRGAPACMHFLGHSYCRFNCGIEDHEMGCGEHTDGKWIWPEGLVHYVEKHDVDLPSDFLAEVRNAREIPRLTKDPSNLPRDLEYWVLWGRNHKPIY